MSAASRLITEALDGIQQLEQDLADEKARANAAEARADAAEAAVEARDARMATLALELANAEAALATRDALLAMQGAELARLDAARIAAEAKVEAVRALHASMPVEATPGGVITICGECAHPWPCYTIGRVNGEVTS